MSGLSLSEQLLQALTSQGPAQTQYLQGVAATPTQFQRHDPRAAAALGAGLRGLRESEDPFAKIAEMAAEEGEMTPERFVTLERAFAEADVGKPGGYLANRQYTKRREKAMDVLAEASKHIGGL